MVPTVFVIGAGASVEFDTTGQMPVGSALAVQIETLLDQEISNAKRGAESSPIADAIMHNGGFRDVHLAAMRRIRDGIHSKNSIDEFIDDWQDVPELARVAKLCIAQRILSAETASVLGRLDSSDVEIAQQLRSLRDTWLGILSRGANPHARRRDVEDVFDGISFIIFNYDRCVEQFLYHTFTNTHALSPEQARIAIANISIYHVYGSLGKFPVVGDGNTRAVPFGANQGHTAFAASSIRTFTEELDSGHIGQIREVVSKAEQIVFLGSAYHQQNMNVLFELRSPEDARIFGTTLGMKASAIPRLKEYFASDKAERFFYPERCKEFIARYDDDIFG